MTRSARYLTWPVALLFSLGACRSRADVQEGVDQYPSGDARVTIEWFAPAARGRFPAILLLHGSGGLDPGTAQVFRAIGRDFAERSYVVFIPHYFERTNHTVGQPFQGKEFEALFEAVEDAIKFAVASENVDGNRLGMIGYSMGAHFAFSRGARDSRIKAIVSCAGSLPVRSEGKYPPVLILQGSRDRANPVENVKRFQELLKANGTPSASRIYKGIAHNFDVDCWEDAAGRAAAFFDKQLRRPRNAKPGSPQRNRARRGSDRSDTPRQDGGADGPDEASEARKNEGATGAAQETVPRKEGSTNPVSAGRRGFEGQVSPGQRNGAEQSPQGHDGS
jgi:dienelactone hydrolase